MRGPRPGLIAAAALLYLVVLLVLLFAPLKIVRYHTRFWELSDTYLGLGWTAARERVLDGAINVAMFLPLGFLVHRWRRHGAAPSRRGALETIGVVAVLAITSETVQIFLPTRYASVSDVLTDVAGAAIGAGLDSALAWIALRRSPGAAETIGRERS